MTRYGPALAQEMLGLTQDRFQGDFTNVPTVKRYWHELSYLLFSRLNFHLLYGPRPFSPAALADHGLIPGELVLFEEETRPALQPLMALAEASLPGSFAQVAALRQQLLSTELSVQKDRLSLHMGKAERDNTGSYYTPAELAKQVVRRALASPAGAARMARGGPLRIADLSCGGGDFFRAAQEVLREQYQIPPQLSCAYFWGTDIDPIALQISICGLLVHAPESRWDEIIGHFHLGNPLLETEQERPHGEKGALFALGRFYAPEMGLRPDWAPEGGFDFVLGNPPWEKIRLEERKFFSNLCPEIAGISKKSDRTRRIQELRTSWPQVYRWYRELSADYARMCSAKFRHSRITHGAAGELNTYALFTELSHSLTSREGVSSLIVKSTLATAPAHKKLWTFLMDSGAVDSLALFDNTQRIFPIDSRERFGVLTLNHRENPTFSLCAGLRRPQDLQSAEFLSLSAGDVATLNPVSRMLPNIAGTEGIGILLDAHRRLPVFGQVYPECHFGRLIHLTAHAGQIDQQPTPENLPIYEGKFLERYDARFSTFEGMAEEKKYAGKTGARKLEGAPGEKPLPQSRYFVRRELWQRYLQQYPRPFSLCWRSLTSPTNARTTLAMILPTCPTCQSIQLLQTEDDAQLLLLLGLFNCLIFDYFVRLKMPGLDLTQSVIRQIPVPSPASYEQPFLLRGHSASLRTHILSCVCARLASEPLLRPLLEGLREPVSPLPDCPPAQLEQMLDQLFARAYGMDGAQLRRVRDAFPHP